MESRSKAKRSDPSSGKNDPPSAKKKKAPGANHSGDVPDDSDAADATLALDPGSMEDEEIAASIREQFREEVGDDLAGVAVTCRRGCITLVGEVASEELREVARLIVEDENGLEVHDRILVSQIAGESPGETEEGERPLPDDIRIVQDDIDAEDVSGDILEVEDEGVGFMAPSRPVPER
ncbi:MAG TPA: BON domain-containing protein [Candidatus Limnocylindrales bacterium]|nr:BON domain-containing protein [Candidatus Limnocylindrales bacterium]